jgi:Tat protein secretion system quality control protein TatD with DNase activity
MSKKSVESPNSPTCSFIDSHCHLQDPRQTAPYLTLVRKCLTYGITHLNLCGTNEQDWARLAALQTKAQNEAGYRGIVANYGLHPWEGNARSQTYLVTLRKILEENASAGVNNDICVHRLLNASNFLLFVMPSLARRNWFVQVNSRT